MATTPSLSEDARNRRQQQISESAEEKQEGSDGVKMF